MIAAADGRRARISDDLTAWVYPVRGDKWMAEIATATDSMLHELHLTEAAAKAAVCHWIGKTMAQFSNALAAGCNEVPDDGN